MQSQFKCCSTLTPSPSWGFCSFLSSKILLVFPIVSGLDFWMSGSQPSLIWLNFFWLSNPADNLSTFSFAPASTPPTTRTLSRRSTSFSWQSRPSAFWFIWSFDSRSWPSNGNPNRNRIQCFGDCKKRNWKKSFWRTLLWTWCWCLCSALPSLILSLLMVLTRLKSASILIIYLFIIFTFLVPSFKLGSALRCTTWQMKPWGLGLSENWSWNWQLILLIFERNNVIVNFEQYFRGKEFAAMFNVEPQTKFLIEFFQTYYRTT